MAPAKKKQQQRQAPSNNTKPEDVSSGLEATEEAPTPASGPLRRHKSAAAAAAAAAPAAALQPLAGGSVFPGRGGGGGGGAVIDSDQCMESVVKVLCIHTEPNFSLPWQRKRQYSSSSSGFIIAGRRILTNAHCVDNWTQVKVKRRGSDEKYVARVLAVGTECDLAVLTVEQEEFWEGAVPVTFGELPRLQAAVTVVGYPIGGDTMSVTSGVVSRIEVLSYVHGAAELLGIQIDAAINSGNSGGPAFDGSGRCVGVAFQSLKNEDAENIGYVIPRDVVEHFLTDYERNGAYTGFPCLGVDWQRMENPYLRAALGMKPGMKGVLVRRVDPTAPASAQVGQFDILLSFDGVPIANDGTVPFRSGERIGFSYLVSRKYVGERATLEVLQNGAKRKLTVELRAPVRLVPFHTGGRPPSYFIVAGLVFTPVTVPYLKSEYGKEFDYEAPVRLLDKMLHGRADAPGEEVVALGHVLAAEATLGYEDLVNTQVLALNGTKITSLQQLVSLVEACTDEYLRFDLDYSQKVVLRADIVKAATQEVLEMHCIASDRSPDLEGGGGDAAAAGAGAGAAAAAAAVEPAAAGGKRGAAAAAKRGAAAKAAAARGKEGKEGGDGGSSSGGEKGPRPTKRQRASSSAKKKK